MWFFPTDQQMFWKVPAFDRMLHTDMSEKETGWMTIKDDQPEIVHLEHKMLHWNHVYDGSFGKN